MLSPSLIHLFAAVHIFFDFSQYSMSELLGKLKRAVTEAAEDLLQDFDRQFESAVHNGESSQETSRPRKHYPDDDETSYSSSLNQVSLRNKL